MPETRPLNNDEVINGITIFVIREALNAKRDNLGDLRSVLELCGDIIAGQGASKIHAGLHSDVMDRCIAWLAGDLADYLTQQERFTPPEPVMPENTTRKDHEVDVGPGRNS